MLSLMFALECKLLWVKSIYQMDKYTKRYITFTKKSNESRLEYRVTTPYGTTPYWGPKFRVSSP